MKYYINEKTILTLIIMLSPIFAVASDYIYVGSTKSINVFANNNIIMANYGIYRVWVKYIFKNTKAGIEEKKYDIKKLRMYGLSYFICLMEFDLEKRQFRDIVTYAYSKDKELIYNETDEYCRFEYIVSNSVDEGLLNFVKDQLKGKTSFPQNKDSNEGIFDGVDQMPSFPGGDGALMAYLRKSIKYPAESEAFGRVIVTFIVEKDGSITNAVVAKPVDPSLDQEALRVVNNMPKWIPGKNNGRNVRVSYTVPVIFTIYSE
jgi:TonB family protein